MSDRGNQPAYPLELDADCGPYSGMTIREAFAMAAMQGFLAQDTSQELEQWDIVHWSVEHADTLLAQLAKEKDDG